MPVERYGWWSLALNALLGSGKVAVGLLAGSTALLADGFNSISDLGTDLALILGSRMASRPEDASHPYGHHKVASLASLFIAVSVVLAAVGLLAVAVGVVVKGIPPPPAPVAVAVAAVSVVAKAILLRATSTAARDLRSRLLETQAWNLRSDVFSSAVALLGAGAAWLGGPAWAIVDPVAGVVLGAFLLRQGWRVFRGACDDLMDAAPEKALVDDLREHILEVPGVIGYHAFRSRRVGDSVDVDLHLQVGETMTVGDGHRVARAVKEAIMRRHPEVVGVLVHVEPATPRHLEKDHGLRDRR